MPTYEYEHIPGIDCLEKQCWTELLPKQVTSVASQLNKKIVLTETFGCSGYDMNPRDLKSILEFQYFQGVNKTCQHLFAYSVSAQGKYDCPPVFSRQCNWLLEQKVFNNYFKRLGNLIYLTKEFADVLVIHPMSSIYLKYIRFLDRKSVEKFEENFRIFLMDLRNRGINYHFADESILSKYGRVEDKKIIIGKCVYSTIIVPNMETIRNSTYILLKKYNGKIYIHNKINYLDGDEFIFELKSNITLDEIQKNCRYQFHSKKGLCTISIREGKIGTFLLIKNYSFDEDDEVIIKNISNNFLALNLENYQTEHVNDIIKLKKGGSIILIKDTYILHNESFYAKKDVTKYFNVKKMSQNFLVMDKVKYSFDDIIYSDSIPFQKMVEYLLRIDYKGKLFLKQYFVIEDKIQLSLVSEKERFIYRKINGNNLDFKQSNFDINFEKADISSFIYSGENEYKTCIEYYQNPSVHFALYDPNSNCSLLTCLKYDTDVEIPYLKGNFSLDKNYRIIKRFMPKVSSDNINGGYPFFYGTQILVGKYIYRKNKKVFIELKGNYIVAKIKINKKSRNIVLSNKVEISSILVEGENVIQIDLKSSLRNLFGPHHYNFTKEPIGYNTDQFTLRSLWKKENQNFYCEQHKLIPFGIDKIYILEEVNI